MAEKILESLEIKTGANTSDKYKLPYNALADPPDLSVYAKLAGNNTFTGGQTITGSNGGYSINASGYIKGSWLQASVPTNKGSNTGKVCVFDGAGWIYYRTPAEILSEAGGAKASDIPDVSGKANLNGGNTFTGYQSVEDLYAGTISCIDEIASINLSACDDGQSGGTPYFGVRYNNGSPTVDLTENASLTMDSNAGISGQVLTSQGAGNTPQWTTPAIKSATLTGTTLTLILP